MNSGGLPPPRPPALGCSHAPDPRFGGLRPPWPPAFAGGEPPHVRVWGRESSTIGRRVWGAAALSEFMYMCKTQSVLTGPFQRVPEFVGNLGGTVVDL